MALHVYSGADETIAQPQVRDIDYGDILDAVRRGFLDFWHQPSHLAFLFLIYPVVGVILVTATSGGNALQLAFPIVTGFALVGPVAAVGLYEISRRRERGLDSSWRHALDVLESPALPSILAVGAMLLTLFLLWLYAAELVYRATFGTTPPQNALGFLSEVLTTSHGWTLILVGNAVGFVFAFIALTTTVVAFPLLVDRDVGAYVAVRTSIRAVAANPGAMLFWGVIVAAALFIGSIPLFVGLAIVIPVLGHATWHVYRKVVEE